MSSINRPTLSGTDMPKGHKISSKEANSNFARIFERDVVGSFTQKLDEHYLRMKTCKDSLISNGREINKAIEFFRTKITDPSLASGLAEVEKRLSNSSRLQAELLHTSNEILKVFADRERIVKKNVVMMLMTAEENNDQLRKELAKCATENQQIRAQVYHTSKPEVNSQFEKMISSLRKIVDHKESVIKKLKEDNKEAYCNFQMTLVNNLKKKSQLMRVVESLSDLVIQSQRISISNVSKNLQNTSLDDNSPKIESNSSIWKPSYNSITRKPEQSIRNPSLKSVSVFGSLDRDGLSIRLDRVSSRNNRDIRYLVDKRSADISLRLGLIASNEKEIATAQTAISEFQAELKSYQQRLTECNMKTIKAMIQLKEGQIQNKSSVIQELTKQSQLLKTEISDIRSEVKKIYLANTIKLRNFGGFVRNQLRVLGYQSKRDDGLVLDVIRKYSITLQTFRKIDLAFSHFRELRLVNHIIAQEYPNESLANKQTIKMPNGSLKIQSGLNTSLDNSLQFTRAHNSVDTGKPLDRDSCTHKSIECEPVNSLRTSKPQSVSDFKAIVSHLSRKLDRIKNLQSDLLTNIQGSYSTFSSFSSNLNETKDALAAARIKLSTISLNLAREQPQSSLSNNGISTLVAKGQAEKMILLSKQILDLKQHIIETEHQFSQHMSSAQIAASKLGYSCKLIKQLEMISEESKLEIDIFGSFEVILSSCQSKATETGSVKLPESLNSPVPLPDGNFTRDEKTTNETKKVSICQQKNSNSIQIANQFDKDEAKSKSRRSADLRMSNEHNSSPSAINNQSKPIDSSDRQKFEEQVHYLLSIISGYEKAFEALKKDQEMQVERKRIKSELKSKELESVLDKLEERPEHNIVCLYQNSNENLSSFKEISENLQINISSLKVLDSKIVEKILAETGYPVNVTVNKTYPHSEQLILGVECSARLTNPPLSTRRMSQDASPKVFLFKSQIMDEFKMSVLKQIKAIVNVKVGDTEALKIITSSCKAICELSMKSFESFSDNFILQLAETKRAVARLNTKLSNLKQKLSTSKDQRDSPSRISEGMKSHSLALRLKEQTDKNNELSETLYQVKRIMTIYTSAQNLNDMPSDQLLNKLEENLQNSKQSITNALELQLKIDELSQKIIRQANQLKAQEDEINDITDALDSEAQRADNALRSHEEDRQVVRKQLLQLTQEKVELEEKSARLIRKIETLENENRNQQKINKGLYELLSSVRMPNNPDFSFTGVNVESIANLSSKFDQSRLDDISLEDIATRFGKKLNNSDHLSDEHSIRFINHFEESKHRLAQSGDITQSVSKMVSVLGDLDKEDHRPKSPQEFKAHKDHAPEPYSPVSIFAPDVTTNDGNQSLNLGSMMTTKVIDFSLQSEESIPQMSKTESSEMFEFFESDLRTRFEESGNIHELFKPKYIRDNELESYKEIGEVGSRHVVVDGIELFSFKHSH
jgi:hypothetical protein